MTFETGWLRHRIRCACSLLVVATAGPLAAQPDELVEPLAGLVALADARRFEANLLWAAARHRDPIVRRHAALSMGRIGAPGTLPMLMELTSDPDSVVRQYAVFSLGLVGSPDALPRLREIVIDPSGAFGTTNRAAAAAAVSRIGGADAASIVTELLARNVGQSVARDVDDAVVRALGSAWRLGADTPIELVNEFVESRDPAARRAAVFALSRLRRPRTIGTLIRSTEDDDAAVRSYAVRTLTAEFADSSGVDRGALGSRVRRLVNDREARVRVNALRAIGTYHDNAYLSVVADRASDSDVNVRVQALATLGEFRGERAVDALEERIDGGVFATRRQALLSLARVAGLGAMSVIADWRISTDWRRRAVAANALGLVEGARGEDFNALLRDPDARVVAAALAGVFAVDSVAAGPLARRFAEHGDAGVRTVALRHLAVVADSTDVALLTRAYERASRDSHSASLVAVVQALGTVAARGPTSRSIVNTRFTSRVGGNTDYRVRRAAEQWFTAVAERWGPARPIVTRRGIADYRDVVRQFVLPVEFGDAAPRVEIETDRGTLEIQLLSAMAPLTVQAFLELVDRRFFDGLLWHRAVPDFVIQSGDSRGDGLGDVRWSLRDEVSPLTFERGTVGLARGAPDTGASEFFITHSAQPQLDGSYTMFGVVRNGLDVLDRITLGDRIRRIRRVSQR